MRQPTLIKNWRVIDWAPDDVIWLQDNGYNFRVATTNIPIAQGNKTTYIRGDVGVSVETCTEEEELMLRLKFEPGLVCMMQSFVMPHGQCTLSDIDWDRT